MAWCTLCSQDRPIQRQTFEDACPYCGRLHTSPHHHDCRGPVPGALDVCTYCNTPLFAKAPDKATYEMLEGRESQIERPDTSAWSLLTGHGVKNLSPERANAIVGYVKANQTVNAIRALREANPAYDLSRAMDIVKAVGKELGVAKPAGSCVVILLFIPYFIVVYHLAGRV